VTDADTAAVAIAPAAPPLATPIPSARLAWYAAILLAFFYWMSILDRFVLALLVDPIKKDLGITDVQLSLLQGFAFTVAFAVFGLLSGALADRYSRRWIIFIGVSIWSLSTAFCAMARSFVHLALARTGMGVGEASINPCASSLLADLHPRERLTRAMAVYSIGSTVGSGSAFFIGGLIIEMVARTGQIHLPLIGAMQTWQAVFLLIGLPGVPLAMLIFTLREPARRNIIDVSSRLSWKTSYGALLKFIRKRLRFFLSHYLGFTIASIVVSGGVAWYPAHMSRNFGWGAGEIGVKLGLTLAAAGIFGKLLCGWVVDSMYRHGYRDAQMRWYAWCLLLAAPIGVLATTSANPAICLMCLFVFVSLVQPMSPCAYASLNLVTPPELRGAAAAGFAATGGILGAGLGATFIAIASEQLYGGGASIGLGLATVFAVCCPLGALVLALGFGAMRTAVAAAEQAAPGAAW
jgi:MFS family permease